MILGDNIMPVTPTKAQDVWKDVGKNVSFVVLKLKRENLATDQEAIAEFADRSQAIERSMMIRAAEANLKVSIGFSRTAWDYLFPNATVPKQLETYTTLTGPEYSMPASEGDIFLHVRAGDEAVVYEIVRQFMVFLDPIATVIDETKGFRYFEGRAIIGFIDGTEAPAEFDDGEKFHNAHNVAAKIEVDGEEQKIVRMNVPFSDPSTGKTGTYFIGYSRYWSVTKAMLQQMVDMSDFLLTFSTIQSGQLFFIPSRDTLGEIADGTLF